MKKNYHVFKIMLALLTLFSVKAGAQLSGVVTIDNTQLPIAPNYTSFTALALDLNSVGVSGPLTVNVNMAIYNEQVNFIQTPGISATNTITFNGNNSTITFSATSTTMRHTLMLTGADYMTFNDLTVVGTNSANALSCHLWAGADHNTFNRCAFMSSTLSTAAASTPFSISGTSVSATATGNSGNNNVVNSCTVTGGYYGVTFYGMTAAPFNSGNQLINSQIYDFYSSGFANGQCRNTLVSQNLFERPNRLATIALDGILLASGTQGALIEKNTIRRLYHAFVTPPTTACYPINTSAASTLGNENVICNNVISNIEKTSGLIYGIYINGAAYTQVYHNTISLDDVNSVSTNATRGIFSTGSSANCRVQNNVITVSQGGTGAKHCLYYAASAATVGLVSDNNVLYMNATGGTPNTAWLGTDFATLAAWQAAFGFDAKSTDVDPIYNNAPGFDFTPLSFQVNNLGVPVPVSDDILGVTRSVLFPDPGAYEIYTSNCSGIPGPNSFVTPTITFCPGNIHDLQLLNSGTYTNTGYAIQWYNSTTSSVGPFVAVPTATANNHITDPVDVTTYYRAVITCTAGGSFTTTSQEITVAVNTTSTVPYYESFENLAQNELPNCSWSGSSMGSAMHTYTAPASFLRIPRTGNNYASFSSSPMGTNEYFTNGIQMIPGVTYSAALWFIADVGGYNNWQELSILVGPNQSPAGQILVASTNGTLTPNLYTLLSNTFTVPNAGLYYVSVRATSGLSVSPHLSWDDLSVTIPCDLNAPNMTVLSNATMVCAGQTASLTAFGADTYSWSTGQSASLIAVSPAFPTTYTLTGYHTPSGCSSELIQHIGIIPSPQVVAYMNGTSPCAGQSVQLSAQGASQYYWNTGENASSIIVSPSVTTNYSVVGTNAQGCSHTAIVPVTVLSTPTISASSSQTILCNGDEVILSANGAQTYQWVLNNTILLGNPVNTSPSASGIYTVIGKNAQGCEGRTTLALGVNECTGIRSFAGSSEFVKVYPNPSSGLFTVELPAIAEKLEISDVSGRVVAVRGDLSSETVQMDIRELAAGVYYVKIYHEGSFEVIKLIKQNN